MHFTEDVTHFDGKFFSTLKYLIFRPGFLAEEYIKGKRASYLNPIRMYLFISAMFFLMLMSFFIPRKGQTIEHQKKQSPISITLNKVGDKFDELDDTTEWSPQSVAQYDSAQRALPKQERDGFIARFFNRKGTAAVEALEKNSPEFKHKVYEKFFHTMPYMLFISVPLIALLLELFYIRRRKEFYYTSHIIFTIQYYCLVFIALLCIFILRRIGGFANTAATVISIGYFIYLYAAMLRFYKQGWIKTLIKYCLLLLTGLPLIIILTILLLVNSALSTVS